MEMRVCVNTSVDSDVSRTCQVIGYAWNGTVRDLRGWMVFESTLMTDFLQPTFFPSPSPSTQRLSILFLILLSFPFHINQHPSYLLLSSSYPSPSLASTTMPAAKSTKRKAKSKSDNTHKSKKRAVKKKVGSLPSLLQPD